MADEPKQIIEFHYQSLDEIPHPSPATKSIPEWMKKMSPRVPPELTGGEDVSTVKRCMPFLDAMTCGYVIPMSVDVRFHLRDATHLDCESSDPVIGDQDPNQFANTPMAGHLVVKFLNVWLVKTPPGYSTLFLPVLNHFGIPFHILAGLVDTDVYYKQIHFPALCLMKPGDRFFLAKGTPIVQAIPIKRESWGSRLQIWDRPRMEALTSEHAANGHFYRDKYWVKKDYV